MVKLSRGPDFMNEKRLFPAFAESPVHKGGDECEKGLRHSFWRLFAVAFCPKDRKADLFRRVASGLCLETICR